MLGHKGEMSSSCGLIPSLRTGELCLVCLNIPTAEAILLFCSDKGPGEGEGEGGDRSEGTCDPRGFPCSPGPAGRSGTIAVRP